MTNSGSSPAASACPSHARHAGRQARPADANKRGVLQPIAGQTGRARRECLKAFPEAFDTQAYRDLEHGYKRPPPRRPSPGGQTFLGVMEKKRFTGIASGPDNHPG